MKTTSTQVTLVKLEAAEGMTITDKAERKVLSKLIYLGKNDSPDNYEEITDEEAAEIKKAQEEEAERQRLEEEERMRKEMENV